jgi:hypothetical protein
MKTPHKHAELIKAWADGAVIQYYIPRSIGIGSWHNVVGNRPSWGLNEDYRIKPENVVKYGNITRSFDTYWSRNREPSHNVMATFDPDGRLLSVEIIK